MVLIGLATVIVIEVEIVVAVVVIVVVVCYIFNLSKITVMWKKIMIINV